jgi:SHS2 domain-containing protein
MAGFQEVEHTADYAIFVWAPSLHGLFNQAALGILSLSGISISCDQRIEKEIQLTALDMESLLVEFLSELIFMIEMDSIAFDEFDIQIAENSILCVMKGSSIHSIKRAIKAVTYHDLEIKSLPDRYEVKIVFDV